MQTADNSTQAATLRIAAIQFLFMLTWIIYGVYFGDLLVSVGLDRSWLAAIFLFDQLVFAFMDPLMGAWADRIEAQARRLAPMVIAFNLLAAAAFVALPLVAAYVPGTPALLLLATAVWVVSASVLRAPLFVLLDRLPGAPNQTTRIAQVAAGIALGAAVAPFIGLWLKGVSPLLPFLLSSAALAVAGFSLPSIPPMSARAAAAEPATAASAETAGAPVVAPTVAPVIAPQRPIFWLFGLTLLLACGFQFHAFVASAALYRKFVGAETLPWLLPVFWVGFSLAMIAVPRWVLHHGADTVLRYVVVLGSAALLVCLYAPSLPLLVAGQALLGACWGGFFLTALRVVRVWPTRVGNGLAMGGWFSMLSLAAAGRISLDKLLKVDALVLETTALVFWIVAATVAWRLFARGERHVAA